MAYFTVLSLSKGALHIATQKQEKLRQGARHDPLFTAILGLIVALVIFRLARSDQLEALSGIAWISVAAGFAFLASLQRHLIHWLGA